MQKVKTIQIGKQSFTLKELPVVVIWALINNDQSTAKASMLDRSMDLLHLACPELTLEVLLNPEQPMFPSEIEELWQGFEEVNAAFLGVIRRIGLDTALIGAVREAITTSIGQFAASLPAATDPASGTTATVSS